MLNSKQKLFIKKVFITLSKKNYQTPINRWKYHYANGDDYFEQGKTFIERMNFSQPFDPKDGHKLFPEFYYQQHANDFRYNYIQGNIPTRFPHITLGAKLYNNHNWDALMHSNEWNDMIPEYQIEEPIESNHYMQHSNHMRAVYMLIYVIIFGVSKYFCFKFTF